MRRGLASSTPLHLLFAFVAMGGWAWWANHDHSLARALASALLQGTLSACLTLYLKRAVEWLSRRFAGLAALFWPPLIAVAGSATLLVTLHRLAGTPALLATVAVPLLVSGSYVTLYNLALWRSRRR